MTKTKSGSKAIYSGSKAIYKGINIITTAMVVLLVIFAALLTLPKQAGIDAYMVLSGSMEPAHRTGSLMYVKKDIDTDQLEVGDVITFRLSGSTVATHRIVEITTDSSAGIRPEAEAEADNRDGNQPVDIAGNSNRMFRTKGDANENPDPNPVAEQDVTGKVLFSIPYLGYAADFVQHPPGIYVALAFGAVLLLLTYITDRRKS